MHVRRSGSGVLLMSAMGLLALAAGCADEVEPPVDLAYAKNPAVYAKGWPIEANVPRSGGDAVSTYSVSPSLPAGLTLNAATGVISGTPTALCASSTHVVTATNDGGSASVALTISVEARLSVLFTTDEHSHVFASAPEADDFPLPQAAGAGSIAGGVARRATVLSSERAADAERSVDTVVVSAGDFSQGTLAAVLFTATSPDLALMSALGYDAIAVGNHEFDLGVQALAGSVATAAGRGLSPPLVLTNVQFDPDSAADDALAALYGEKGSGTPIARARVITTAHGIHVGVVAALGPAAAYVAPLSAPLRFTGDASPADRGAAIAAIAAQVQPVIDGLRSEDGVDVVVMLGHGGVGPTGGVPGDDELLAAALRGVDLVVSGHTHRAPDVPILVADADDRQVPIMQAAPFGEEVGRAELVVQAAARPQLDADPARTRFIRVDDRIVPTLDAAVLAELAAVIGALEVRAGEAPSFLEATLSLVTGSPVADDPGALGDLYYRSIGHSTFDVIGLRPGETNALNLDTDAMLAAARALVPDPTAVALQNTGSIRGDLLAGATGELAFADVYRLVPLGADPVEASPGYPLVRFHVSAAELYGALDMTAKTATQDGDFFLSPSGLVYAYDTARSPADGWISRIATVGPDGNEATVLYDDALDPAWRVDPFSTLVPVVTTLYVASFAESAGVTPKDAAGDPVTLASAVLTWPGGSHVKDHQALASFVHEACATNGGELPSAYDETAPAGAVPRRVLCAGPACP